MRTCLENSQGASNEGKTITLYDLLFVCLLVILGL